MSLIGKAVRLLNQSKAPIPLGDGASAARRGLSYNLGSGRADAETHMRQYGMSGTIFGIVSLLAESAATPHWRLYKKPPKDGRVRYTTGDQGSDQRTEVVQHAAIQLLNNPNDFHSRFEYFEGCQQHEELTGETFWVLDNEAGFPTSMWYVRPDRMQPVPDPDQFLLGWIYTGPNGVQVPLRTTEVILEKRPDPLDPYRGAGPVASILPNIQQQRYATEYQRNLFLNGADPGGIIQVPTTLSEPQFDDLVDRWRESHRGVARAGMVGVLENGATWIPNAHSNKDMEYGQLRLANRDELREAWRIHKAMMGSSDDVNRANAQTAQEVFVAWQVIPRLNRRRDTLNSKLLPLFKDKSVEFDYDDPFPPNAENASKELLDKAQAWAALVDGGADPHDALEVVGLPDMDMAEVATQSPALPPSWVSTEQAVPGAPAAPEARQRIAIRSAAAAPAQPAAPAAPQQPTQQQIEKIDLQWKAAVALLVAAWTAHVLPSWYAALLGQIRDAITNGDPDALTALTVPDDGIDDAADTILAHTRPFAAAAARQAADEAAHQGARGAAAVTPDEAALIAAARASAQLQAQQAALSAGREAFRVAGPDADPDDVADHVEEFLNGLSDAGPTAAASQVMSAAQNHARLATIAAGPRAQIVATEVHDGNTCDPCDDINGHVFGYSDDPDAVAEAAAAYPAGGYALCEGGPRCRGTVFGVYGGATNRYGGGIRNGKDAAAKVFAQVAEDFPPAATAWMHHATWTGPVAVPLTHVDWEPTEMQGKDPDRVAVFVKKLQDGKKLKPVILVKTPGNDKLELIDGHHRFLAAAQLKSAVRAFIGIVDEDHGPWETMHDMQYVGHQNRARPAIGAAASLTKAQVHYRDAAQMDHRCGTCSMFRAPDACTLVKGLIRADGVCDRWAAKSGADRQGSPDMADLARRVQQDGWVPVQIGGRS